MVDRQLARSRYPRAGPRSSSTAGDLQRSAPQQDSRPGPWRRDAQRPPRPCAAGNGFARACRTAGRERRAAGAGSPPRRDRADHGCRRIRAQAGGRVSEIGRRVRAAINPVSTAATRWWCHSAMRHMLTGYGPAARQRRSIRPGMTQGAGPTSPAAQMKARAAAIDPLPDQDDHKMRGTHQHQRPAASNH
jgi:hypothetical protein